MNSRDANLIARRKGIILTERKVLKWLIIIALLILVLYLATIPARKNLSNHLVKKGDTYLAQKEYLSAELQYEKVLTLSKKNVLAKDRLNLAKEAENNVLALEDFYKESGNAEQIELFREATSVPKSAKSAVILSKELIEKGEYQLAAVAAGTAVEMDKDYDLAKTYRSIALSKAKEVRN